MLALSQVPGWGAAASQNKHGKRQQAPCGTSASLHTHILQPWNRNQGSKLSPPDPTPHTLRAGRRAPGEHVRMAEAASLRGLLQPGAQGVWIQNPERTGAEVLQSQSHAPGRPVAQPGRTRSGRQHHGPRPHVTATSDIPLPDTSSRHTPGTPRPECWVQNLSKGTRPGKRTETLASIALTGWVKIQLQTS